MKQGNAAAPSHIVRDERVEGYFKHRGHPTAVSQRTLQAHADPWPSYTGVNGVGSVVSELSPYVENIDWSGPTLVGLQTEGEFVAAVSGKEDEFVDEMVAFGCGYSELVRDDHRLFMDDFRGGRIPGLSGD